MKQLVIAAQKYNMILKSGMRVNPMIQRRDKASGCVVNVFRKFLESLKWKEKQNYSLVSFCTSSSRNQAKSPVLFSWSSVPADEVNESSLFKFDGAP